MKVRRACACLLVAFAAVTLMLPAAASATTTVGVAPAAPNVGNGNGIVAVFGDEFNNDFRVYDSAVPRREDNFKPAWAAAAAPAYRRLADEAIETIGPSLGPGRWSGLLLARVSGVATAFAILLDAKSTEDLKEQQFVIVEERSPDARATIEPLPPCRTIRYLRGQAPVGVRAVICPTLRRYQTDPPPDLYVSGGDGDDQIELALADILPTINERIVEGGDGADTIFGSQMGDLLSGDEGPDRIYGRRGNDEIWGHDAREWNQPDDIDTDTLYGDEGNDLVFGGHDPDLISGGPDNDDRNAVTALAPYLQGLGASFGSSAALQGGTGNDVVIGGTGSDTMAGNEESDTMLANERDFAHPVDEYDPLVDCQGSLIEPPSTTRPELFRKSVTLAFQDNVVRCNRQIGRRVSEGDVRQWDRYKPFPWLNW